MRCVGAKVIAPDATEPERASTSAGLDVGRSADLPPGLPEWMRSERNWATRIGMNSDIKRATIQITVPPFARAATHP